MGLWLAEIYIKAAPTERAYAIISGAAAIPTDCTAKAAELFTAEVFPAAVTMDSAELVITDAAANAVTASFKSAAPVGRLSRAMTIVRIAGNSACKNSAND